MSDSKRMVSKVTEQDDELFGQDEMVVAKKPAKGFVGKIMIVVLVVVIALGALFLVSKYTSWNVLNVSKTDDAGSKDWKAVFLTNGQVYFGRIVKQSNSNIELKNIYYLQVTRQLQPAPSAQPDKTSQEQQQLSLVKLGDELHGPTDYMVINRSQVLFTEELKEDSKVVDAIKRYIEDQANKK